MKYIMLLILFLPACKKYLDKKPNATLTTITSVEQLQGLMDETKVNQQDPSSPERCADDYYLGFTEWNALSEPERRMYTWEKDNLYPKSGVTTEWPGMYQLVFKGNLVLEQLERIERKPGDEAARQYARGNAHFLRGKGFFNAVTVFALAYDPQTAASTLGIPLRYDPDFTIVSVRSSVKDCYEQILSDFKAAAEYLPPFPSHVVRPSQTAAYAYLARTYLLMMQFDSAKRYADLCLQIKNNLLDYNTVNAAAQFPFAPRFSNPEVIYDCYMTGAGSLAYNIAKIDSVLYSSYASNDLRKTIFFKSNNNGTYGMKGDYLGFGGPTSAIATDELYLIRSECRARTGDLNGALSDLNALLIKRWKTGFFQPVTAATTTEALSKILIERRKELVYRGLRWLDIKRLNVEGYNISLTRKLNGQTYTLPANHPRFALPIPDDVIQLSGMPQNPR